MKFLRRILLSLPLVALSIVPYTPAVSADIQVSVFSFPGLTEGDLSCADEVDNLEEIISRVPGYTVDRTITTLADVDGQPTLLQRLNDSRFFFVPDMERAFTVSSNTDFPASAVTAFQTWLNGGGVLVMTGTSGTKDVDFLNKITSWGLASAGGLNGATRNDANAAGTPFGEAALDGVTLGIPSATDSINKNTAPAEANFKAMWGTTSQAPVATMNYGRGSIIYLGWDYFNSGYNGANPCSTNSDPWVQKIIPAALEYAAQLSESGLANPDDQGGDLTYSYVEAGTNYFVVVARNDTAPTAAQIKAGIDYTGGTVLQTGNQAANAGEEVTFEITGLTPASDYTAYLVTETAVPAFSAVTSVQFSTAPGTPTVSSVTAGDGEATVVISPFGTETNFEYSTDGGTSWISRAPAAVTSPWVITGLTNGTNYSLTFRSAYRTLRGVATAASTFTPVGVAGAPTNVSGTDDGDSVNLSWTAPASDGGAAITGYKIEISTDNGATWTVATANTGSNAATAKVSGLGVADYKFRVYAINAQGTSTASVASAAVSVTATAPGAPTDLQIVHNAWGSATVTWAAPANNGGSVLTGYSVQYEVGGDWIALKAEGAKAIVANVLPTQAWSFRVAAVNAIGSSSFAVKSHKPPAPYSGPIVTNLSKHLTPHSAVIEVLGMRLSEVSAASIDAKECRIISVADGRMVIELPELTPGIKDLVMSWGSGVVTHQDAFLIQEQSEEATEQKVNAGSFKGYVALYAKGFEGQRLSAKVGNDWVIVDELASDFERIVEYTGSGYEINLRIFVDRVLMKSMVFTTK